MKFNSHTSASVAIIPTSSSIENDSDARTEKSQGISRDPAGFSQAVAAGRDDEWDGRAGEWVLPDSGPGVGVMEYCFSELPP
jgi:hypothetical protein